MSETGHWNAMRFAQSPLPQPSYNFAHVPKSERDLKGSSLQRVDDRENLKTCMAEMLLLCKEAMRRRPGKGNGSKPLSLEYLADRLDVDDPCFGYMVRTNENLNKGHVHWEKGMLQGFITVTTFTNWQKTFRWDSTNEVAFSYDDEECDLQRVAGTRKWDVEGSLAADMQGTVHIGDIWNEGIVWPRIAEISLLGGLGCGRALVSLVIEELERMKATGKFNYDYITLQATDNSIPFYESVGFSRVGALVQDESNNDDSNDNSNSLGRSGGSSSTTSNTDDDDAVEAEPVEEGSPEKSNAIALKYEIFTSPLSSYTIKKSGETPNDIAKKFKVDVWDIIFLNKDIYTELGPGSRILANTVIHMPPKVEPKPDASMQLNTARKAEAETPRWYVAKENETPRSISKKVGVNCLDLIEANRARLPGLMSNSRLKDGTRIKVSHFDVQEEADFKPYAHWTFPDDKFEDGEPSYMMAMKLNRCRGAAAKYHPFQESLAVPVSQYEPTSLLLPPSPVRTAQHFASLADSADRGSRPVLPHPDEPQPPKRPLGPYMLFAMEQRDQQCPELEGLTLGEASKIISDRWRNLSDLTPYEDAAKKLAATYRAHKEVFDSKLAAFKATLQTPFSAPRASLLEGSAMKVDLFNKVVRLKPGAMTEGSEFSYWFVLTFIPDLKWCHLAPMIQVGTFGPDKRKAEGRPKWKLVDEALGKEVDISSSFCIPIKSKSMKRTQDADKEEWDLYDDGSCPGKTKPGRRSSVGTQRSACDSDVPESAIKPSVEKKRKHSALESNTGTRASPLIAIRPGSDRIIYIKLSGKCLDENEGDDGMDGHRNKGRGRPKGSKNKPKLPPSEPVAIAPPPPPPPPKRAFVPPVEPDVVAPPPERSPARPRKAQAVYSVFDPPKRGPRKAPPVEPAVDAQSSDVDADAPKRNAGRPRKDKQGVPQTTGRGRPKGSTSKLKAPPPGRPKRTERNSTTSPLKSTVALAPASLGPERGKMDTYQSERPRRSAAPSYLGESPSTGTMDTYQSERPRRSAAPSYLGESPLTPQASGSLNRGRRNSSSRTSIGFVRDATVPSSSPARPRRIAASSNLLTSPIQRSSSRRPPQSTEPIRTSPVRRTNRSESVSTAASTDSIQHLPTGMSPVRRPRRSAAPLYLGETPMLASPPPSATSNQRNGEVSPLISQTSSVNVRPKRNAAPSFLGETLDRKRRKFDSPASPCIVL